MKAAIYNSYGPPEVLKIENIDKPALQPEDEGKMLVKIHSASVNPYDYLHRKGYGPIRFINGFFTPKQPILGIDVAGTVEAVGANVSRFKIGDPVFGSCEGAFAEYVSTHEDHLSLLPQNVSFEQGAAIPTAALTAVQALRDVAQIKKGQQVLIYGASGGIGHLAVQLARYYETEVTAVTSTANQSWVKTLGADHMIDYTKEDFTQNGKQYDIILDAVGKRTFFSCRNSLKETGVYITEHILYPKYHPIQLPISALIGDKRMKIHLANPNAKDLDFFAELMADGTLKPVIEQCYPFDQIVVAHRHVENGHTKGKVVIQVQNQGD